MNIINEDASGSQTGAEAAATTPVATGQPGVVYNVLTGINRPGGSAAFLDIHYHGSSAGDVASGISRPGGSAAFLDIHYHGSSLGQAVLPGQEAAAVPAVSPSSISPSSVRAGTAVAAGIARPGGSAAFLDIHYHGSSAGDVASGISRPGGSAAFLDIHYHGSSLGQAVLPGQEAAAVPAVSPSSISPSSVRAGTAVAAGIARPGGSAAFLDIHYHGSSAGDVASEISRPGGSAAFLDIHYHGSSLGQAVLPGQEAAAVPAVSPSSVRTGTAVAAGIARPGGSAAFLDIHYHGSSLGQAVLPGQEAAAVSAVSPSSVSQQQQTDAGRIHIYGA